MPRGGIQNYVRVDGRTSWSVHGRGGEEPQQKAEVIVTWYYVQKGGNNRINRLY